jgi:YbbR domain-containing protein
MPKENKALERLKKIVTGIKNLPKAFFSINLNHNTGTKIFSLVLAILFWVFVMDQVDPEITKVIESVPVQLINQQELDQNDLIIMDQYDYFVNVEITGRRNNVLNTSKSSIYLWADVRNVKKGSNVLQINKTINSEAVTIQTLIPNEIVLSIDQIVSIPKPVKVTVSGTYPESLYQSGMTISPEEVKVTGPESVVNQVAYLGGTLNVSNIDSDTTKEISLVPYDNDGEMVSGVTLDESYSSVSINVGMSKTVSVTPVINGTPMEGYEIVSATVTPESILISGNEAIVNALTEVQAEPINLKGEETATLIVEKSLELPSGIKSDVENGNVQIEVQIEPIITKEFNFNIKDIPIVNLSDSLSTNLNEQTGMINIKVKDVESVINSLTKDDIHLSINFGIVDKAGLYRLKVNVANEDRYKELSIDPVYIEVQVTE